MTLAAVLDTGPLIHLAEIGSLSLLSAFDRLYVPETVYEELEASGVPDGLSDLAYELVAPNEALAEAAELDPGERAVLTAAKERSAILLTDDLSARETATDVEIEVHGSIGVISLGCARGRIDGDEAASLMRTLQRETSLFVTDAIVERGIDALDEG